LRFLLTGEPVFRSRNDIDHLMQHLHVAPTPPSHSAEQPIPKSVDDLVLACLQKDPALRPTSVDEVSRYAMTGTADDVRDGESARKWWEMHLPGNRRWSHRTRETKVETHTESAWLIPSWRD
jgi:serine/threonine protein kinase